MKMRLLAPDLYYTGVLAIDLDELKLRSVDTLLIDLDNTLAPRDTHEVRQEMRDWVRHARSAGFRLCIVSNNWHGYVAALAASLDLPLVPRAAKPLPGGFRRAMRVLDATPAGTAVIGDQLFTDVLGGNLVGATTVLVVPLSRSDLPHTLLLRLIEARILSDREPAA
jgi:uncharacterized protein